MDRPSVEDQTTHGLIQELEDMALDPTLDQCCRRDIESRITKERIRHSLQQQDRIDARQRLAAAAICRDPDAVASLPEQHAQESQQQQGSNAAVQQQDAELEELRRQRLRQLQSQSAVQQEQQRVGFGSLNVVQDSKLMALLSDPPGRGLLVVHLAVQGYEPCDALDECLEAAAAQYRGTYFARVVVPRVSPLVGQLQLPGGVPALLVVRDGGLLGKAHISQFGGHDVWDEEVMSYLRRFKVLSLGSSSSACRSGSRATAAAAALAGGQLEGSTAAAAAGGGTQPASSSESESDEGSEDSEGGNDWCTPCEVCGRTYPHTHVRAIYSTQQQGSSDDEAD